MRCINTNKNKKSHHTTKLPVPRERERERNNTWFALARTSCKRLHFFGDQMFEFCLPFGFVHDSCKKSCPRWNKLAGSTRRLGRTKTHSGGLQMVAWFRHRAGLAGQPSVSLGHQQKARRPGIPSPPLPKTFGNNLHQVPKQATVVWVGNSVQGWPRPHLRCQRRTIFSKSTPKNFLLSSTLSLVPNKISLESHF